MKLGSLFDGSGGFPLAATMCGIIPVWASEVEPYPIAVTRSRFPNMKHIGDVSKVNGAEIEPVDIITFGSPCQDLSVAGKRAGIKDGTRSGLFLEAIRIIKEMRESTGGMYPAFALWENVPGAFSSNNGEDFRTVLQEFVKIKEPSAVMPPVPAGGWAYADSYMGDGWSLAYRTLDAQYWGVPQRRRRIYLVADFRGKCAGEILFKRQGLRGHFEAGRTPWQRVAADAQGSADTADRAQSLAQVIAFCQNQRDEVRDLGGVSGAISATAGSKQQTYVIYPDIANSLVARHDGSPQPDKGTGANIVVQAAQEQYLFENHAQDARYKGPLDVCPMLPAQLGTGGNNTPLVVEKQKVIPINDKATRWKGGGASRNHDGSGNGLGVGADGDPAPTLTAGDRHAVCYAIQSFGNYKESEKASSIKARDYKDATDLVVDSVPTYCLQGNGIGRADTAGCNGKGVKEDVAYTLNTIDRHAVAYGVNCLTPWENQARRVYGEDGAFPALPARETAGQNQQSVLTKYIVRRLTPTECARLQGFPDEWGHPDHKDDFTDEEYTFWMDVRNTHAAINGKAERQYTKEQMLAWYNKLHTDSAEYRMWGNGIALPTALYVMQGIAEELTNDVI